MIYVRDGRRFAPLASNLGKYVDIHGNFTDERKAHSVGYCVLETETESIVCSLLVEYGDWHEAKTKAKNMFLFADGYLPERSELLSAMDNNKEFFKHLIEGNCAYVWSNTEYTPNTAWSLLLSESFFGYVYRGSRGEHRSVLAFAKYKRKTLSKW